MPSLIATLPPEKLPALKRRLDRIQKALAAGDWRCFANDGQMPPDGAWRIWLVLAGRGFGKTRAGAEWVRAQVRAGAGRIGLIAPTAADARDIMVEGDSGLLAVCRETDTSFNGGIIGRPVHEPSRHRLVWPNGAVAKLFSAEEPERLRGPQHEKLWCDEMCAWRNLQRSWDMAMFGLRLGQSPQVCITTTPKPLKLLGEITKFDTTAVTRGTTYENAIHLAPGFIETVTNRYGGTRLGRQEIEGEIVAENTNALWDRAMLDAALEPTECEMQRIVIGVDPPASSGRNSDACGIVVAGLGADGLCYVLADATLAQVKPNDWAIAVARLYSRYEADRVVAEVNQGGDMVEAVMRTADPAISVRKVRATRGKWVRAEPVAALYEQGRVRHAAPLPNLEDEMCAFGTDGMAQDHSPDRVDALVWAVTDLMLVTGTVPRVRATN